MTVDVSARTQIATSIRAYARRLHAVAGDRHHVASPLGAWLLLALCARACAGRDRDVVAEALAMDVDEAFALASRLVDQPPPAVAAALGVWMREGVGSPALARWLAALPVSCARGPIPTQAELDAWIRDASRGVVEQASTEVDPLDSLLLVSVIATDVKWDLPFGTRPGSMLGAESPWSDRLARVLFASGGGASCIAATDRIGDVAVHVASSDEGLDVVSVIAERSVPPLDVLDAAYEIAIAIASGEPVAVRSLFELPLGETARWTIESSQAWVRNAEGSREELRVAIPAWSAEANLSLDDRALGLSTAARAIEQLLDQPQQGRRTLQAARASYMRLGFRASAESSMRFGSLGPQPRGIPMVRRVATLRFGHPYAVVAVLRAVSEYRSYGEPEHPWKGLPVFSAWVAEPEEADVEERAFFRDR